MARAVEPRPPRGRWHRAARQGAEDTYGAPGRGGSAPVSIASALALLLLWWCVTELGLVRPLFLPSPGAVLSRLARVLEEGFADASLWEHARASLSRVISAFALACVTAVPVGIAMGVNRHLRGALDPPLEFYRPIPPLAYLPLTIIWFGIGELQKVVLIYLAVFAPMALSARSGVRSATVEQIRAALSMGASRVQVVRHIVVPAALPEILTGMRIGIGFGWTTLVAAEMVAASAGLGFMVLSASEFLVTEVVIVGIVVIGAIAYAFDLAMRALERRLVPWKGRD